jgi:N6-adenosine-specific RNA methylase IME4
MSATFIIEDFAPVIRTTLRGFCRVRTPSGMVLHDVAVHQKDGAAWVSPASKPMIDRDGAVMRDAAGKIQYAPFVSFASREIRGRWSAAVIAALRKQSRRADMRTPAPAPFTRLPPHEAGVMLADPPWNFVTYSRKGWRKSAHAHYPCMDLEEILALPVATLAAPDSVLVLWSTQVHLRHALAVLEGWEFAFKTMGAWAKQSKAGRCWQFGTGHLLRSATEPFLVGTRGRPQQLSRSIRNLIVAPVREHSRKPEEMYDLIEKKWPGPYVELFARYPRAGWRQWPEPRAAEDAP